MWLCDLLEGSDGRCEKLKKDVKRACLDMTERLWREGFIGTDRKKGTDVIVTEAYRQTISDYKKKGRETAALVVQKDINELTNVVCWGVGKWVFF